MRTKAKSSKQFYMCSEDAEINFELVGEFADDKTRVLIKRVAK